MAERPQGVVPDLDRVDAERARDAVRRLDSHPDADWLDPETASELLGTVGIAVQPSVQATSQHQALEAAGRPGYPVALKTEATGIVHKTDVGGVRLGLRDRAELRSCMTR